MLVAKNKALEEVLKSVSQSNFVEELGLKTTWNNLKWYVQEQERQSLFEFLTFFNSA